MEAIGLSWAKGLPVLGEVVSPVRHVHPDPQNATLFGHSVSADVICEAEVTLE